MAELRVRGRPASPGFARGPLVFLEPVSRPEGPADRPEPSADITITANGLDADEQSERLNRAIATSIDELRALIDEMARRGDGEAAEMLAFQQALLEDRELTAPAHAAIASGRPVAAAWHEALAVEISGYESSSEEYFRARTADLADLRDRVERQLIGGAEPTLLTAGAIVIARDLAPSRFLAIDWSNAGALLLTAGSTASHVAMLARSRSVPMIVGLSDTWQQQAPPGATVLADATRGEVIIDPEAASIAAFTDCQRRDQLDNARAASLERHPAATADGTPVKVTINVADAHELDDLDPDSCDGIGLARTEFLFREGGALPDEDAQYAVYVRLIRWAAGRPVTIRTLDAGGDKPIAGFTIEGESNPFLGMRGLRLSLKRPDVFRIQLRALLRAAECGPLRVMLPMVTLPAEFTAARELMSAELTALAAQGVAARMPELGIMVEVPAAAIMAEAFEAEFFSIGSNDLTQYVAAAGRDVGDLAELADPVQPAMLALMSMIVRAGERLGIETSLCGDAAGDVAAIPALLTTGLRTLSVAPARIGAVKQAIASVRLDGGG